MLHRHPTRLRWKGTNPIVDPLEQLAAAAYDDGDITEVIRPAAIIPEEAVRAILVELSMHDIFNGGPWHSQPNLWSRYDRPWGADHNPAGAELIGNIQVAYGTPTRYEITIYRVTITRFGAQHGWTVESLTDEALGYGGLTLEACPRASLTPPPKPFRF